MEQLLIKGQDYLLMESGANGRNYYVMNSEVAGAMYDQGYLEDGDHLYDVTGGATYIYYDEEQYSKTAVQDSTASDSSPATVNKDPSDPESGSTLPGDETTPHDDEN